MFFVVAQPATILESIGLSPQLICILFKGIAYNGISKEKLGRRMMDKDCYVVVDC